MYWNKAAFREAGLDPEKPRELERNGRDGPAPREEGRGGAGPALGRDDPLDGISLLDVPGARNAERAGADEPRRHRTFYDAPATVAALEYLDGPRPGIGSCRKGPSTGGRSASSSSRKTAIMWHTTGNLTAVKTGATFDFGVGMLLPRSGAAARPGRQLLRLQEDDARGAQGGTHVRQVDHRAGAGGPVEHRHRLRRGPAGRLRHAATQVRRGLPGGGRRARPAQVRDGGALHVRGRPSPEASRRRHPGCAHGAKSPGTR